MDDSTNADISTTTLDLTADFARMADLEKEFKSLRVAIVSGLPSPPVIIPNIPPSTSTLIPQEEVILPSAQTPSRSDTIRRELKRASDACDALLLVTSSPPSTTSSLTTTTGSSGGGGLLDTTSATHNILLLPTARSLSDDALTLKVNTIARAKLIALGLDLYDDDDDATNISTAAVTEEYDGERKSEGIDK